MSTQEYAPVSENVGPSAELLARIRVSSRVVAFYCFVQMVVAGLFLFSLGSILEFCVTAFFVSLGLAGVIKRRFRLVIAHFIFSVVVYVFTLVVLVFAIIYCDECQWYSFAIVGIFAIIQSIALKHCRLLITALRNLNEDCSGQTCPCPQDVAIEMNPVAVEVKAPVPAPAPTAPNMPMMQMYPPPQYPNFQGMPMPYPYMPSAYAPNMQSPYPPNMQAGYGPNAYPMMTFPTAPVQPPAYRQ